MIQGMTRGSNTSNTPVSRNLNKLWNCLKAIFSKHKFSTTTKIQFFSTTQSNYNNFNHNSYPNHDMILSTTINNNHNFIIMYSITISQHYVIIPQLSIIHQVSIYIYIYVYIYIMNMQIHHQSFNYQQINIPKHITKTRARISTSKFIIITYSNKHLCIELGKKLQLKDYEWNLTPLPQ